MPEYLDTYLEFEDVKNRNPFIGRKPDTSELPDFEINKSRLPEPVWDGHDESVEAYYKAWEIAFPIFLSRQRKTVLSHPISTRLSTAIVSFGTAALCLCSANTATAFSSFRVHLIISTASSNRTDLSAGNIMRATESPNFTGLILSARDRK